MNDTVLPRRVLIVEDDTDSAELERRVLSRAGFMPQVAPSLAEAGRLLASGEFVALLLDYRLPDGDAWDLVSAARSMMPHVPVILVTAIGNEAVAAEAVLRGVSEYIRKADGFHDQISAAVERATRLAQAHEALRRNDSLFRTIADYANDAIVLLDSDDAIMWASAAAHQVFEDEDHRLIGRKLEELLHPDDRANWRNGGQATGATVRHVRCRDKLGRYLSFEPNFRSISDDHAARTVGVLRDVTDRLQLEERLRHHQRLEAVGQLTGGIAHDFNNLLAVMIANLDVLRDQLDGLQAAQELAGDALEAALRGAELTARLLAFARRQPLWPAPCDVNATISAMVKLLDRTLGEDVAVGLELADDLWPVEVDRVQLETALTNLATNARDAMPRGGRLVISTRNVYLGADYAALHSEVTPNDYVMIEVRDTGTGIPPEILDRIYEPFFTTKDVGKGTGLGLSMVFGFIKQSGGHISAWSEIGSGTAIRLYLPRTKAVCDVTERDSSPPVQRATGHTVLVVEDNSKLRQIVMRQLTEAGYRVLEAVDGNSALALLKSDVPIDLLFTDIVMPGMPDGHDLAQTGERLRPGIKIVLTSGYSDPLMLDRNGTHTEYRLLHKPYRRSALLQCLREVMDGEASGVA